MGTERPTQILGGTKLLLLPIAVGDSFAHPGSLTEQECDFKHPMPNAQPPSPLTCRSHAVPTELSASSTAREGSAPRVIPGIAEPKLYQRRFQAAASTPGLLRPLSTRLLIGDNYTGLPRLWVTYQGALEISLQPVGPWMSSPEPSRRGSAHACLLY